MIELRILGSPQIIADGHGQDLLAQPKRLALLSYLACPAPGTVHRRDTLIALLWPEFPEDRARAALRKTLYHLRRSLGPDVLITNGDDSVAVNPRLLTTDLNTFNEAIAGGDHRAALQLYRDDVLAGFYLRDAPEYEDWQETTRTRARDAAIEAAWSLADEERDAGNGIEAARWGRHALALGGHDESALQRLMILLDGLGDRAGAVNEYHAFAQRLDSEWNAVPSPETDELLGRIQKRLESNGRSTTAEWNGASRTTGLSPWWKWAAAGAVSISILTGALVANRANVTGPSTPGPLNGQVGAWYNRPPEDVSLVIIPPATIRDDRVTSEFARVLTENIAGRVSRIRGLRVVSSVFARVLLAAGHPPAAIAESLNVGHALQLSVEMQTSALMVRTTLVASGRRLEWEKSFRMGTGASGAERDSVVDAITDAVVATWMTTSHPPRAATAARARADAILERTRPPWNANFAQGSDSASRMIARNVILAIADTALAVDSTFGNAWGVRALVRSAMPSHIPGYLDPWHRDSTLHFIDRALQLGVDAKGSRVVGIAYAQLGRLRRSLDVHVRGLRLDPTFRSLYYGVDGAATMLGELDLAAWSKRELARRTESGSLVAVARIALLLGDYASADSLFRTIEETFDATEVGYAELAALTGQMDSARARVQRWLPDESDPENDNKRFLHAAARLDLVAGDYARARERYERFVRASDTAFGAGDFWHGDVPPTNLAYVLLQVGDRQSADRLIARSIEWGDSAMAAGDDSFAPPYNRARIGAMLGRKDEAYHWLEQAIEMGWRYYYQLNMGPNDRLLENLHGDRRFQTMMARVKHEVDSMLVNLVEERVRR